MKYPGHHASLATWRLYILRQLLETSFPSHITRRSIVSTAQLRDQAAPKSDNPADDRTERIPPSQRLPQSPLVTHPRNEPEKDHKKGRVKDHLEPLSANPWAVALASPPRYCSLTSARLPRDLLGDWGLARGSDAEKIHLLPVGLLKENLENRMRDQTSDTKGSLQDEVDPPQQSGESPSHDRRQNYRPVMRMVDSLPLLRKVTPPLCGGTPKKPAVSRLLPFRWKHPNGPITSREEKALVWRNDMPEYVRRLLQQNVADKLRNNCRKFYNVEPPNKVWNVLEMHECTDDGLEDALRRLPPVDRAEFGAVVLFGSIPEARILSDTVMLPQAQKRIPIFDLSALLSESDLHGLFEAVRPHFHNRALLFRPASPVSVETLLSLWKLKRFLAEDPKLGI